MPKKLYRIEDGKILAGVCGGLGDYLNLDYSIVRLIVVVLSIGSIGLGLIGYIIAAMIVPTKSQTF